MSVVGTTQKQPRVFAHDAWALSQLDSGTWSSGDPIIPALPIPATVPPDQIPYTFEKTAYFYNIAGVFHEAAGAVALYVVTDLTRIEVIMEGAVPQRGPQNPPITRTTIWSNIPAGTLLPISVLTVVNATPVAGTWTDVILALY